ncbi:MAG: ATP-dependent helicase [Mesorhizobium sp.]|uniref:UvrD-helicase domain-containing protein n=1 Tax=Mesorhizobium sp. TaxID=1871066 RepID=UPI000FE8E005|nr:ATP-dependent helicase [Mesorhizobium sp.]RWQ45672.1 MAG: ATP-dependent helicase [Mesorhizobium sp.]
MELTEKQKEIMATDGHLLVTGGPGSGKTTVSILKAAKIAEQNLRAGQKILFLSFARATVSRVVEAIEYEQQIPHEQKRRIDVDTYHSFFWRIMKTHGYLIGLPRRLFILTPPAEAIALSLVRFGYASKNKITDAEKAALNAAEEAERLRLARDEGRICFDLYAPYVGDILHGSERIRKLIAATYPVIILDEFQDTNADQWRVVQALGEFSILIALADPEQRIYDWIGADPKRLDHFREAFAPKEVDLSTDNHRSAGTDIAMFGNDLLTGNFRQEKYNGIAFRLYEPYPDQAMTALVTSTYAARKRLVETGRKGWSLAILVPTKKMTRLVSDAFRSPPAGLTEIPHMAAIELDGAILGAEVIAFLMQPEEDAIHFQQFIDLVKNYFHGKGGDTPTKGALQEADNIQKAYNKWRASQATGKAIGANSILVALLAVYQEARALALTGNPDEDWKAVRSVLERGACSRLKELGHEVRNIRLLDRGTQLRQELSQDWRDTGAYRNALAIVRLAFVHEHFSTNAKPETGIVLMNMHKAKGKQFDEVIVFEGWPRVAKGKIVANLDRIVRGNDRAEINDQARQNFRVSVTRGKQRVTILTPKGDPCVLLTGST